MQKFALKSTRAENVVFPSLLDQITIEHGPASLLGRFFLVADAAARRQGLYLSFASFDELAEANRRNRDTWKPLFSVFDPANGTLTPENSFCLLGRNRQGEVVATQAARLYAWDESNFADEITSLRLFYPDPARQARPGERCTVTAPSAHRITGRVVFSGGGWYRPDYRKRDLATILPRISRALAYTRWKSDFTMSLMAKSVVDGGMAARCGYTNVEYAVDLNGCTMGDICFALVWMKAEQMLNDLEQASSVLTSEVDRRVYNRRAN